MVHIHSPTCTVQAGKNVTVQRPQKRRASSACAPYKGNPQYAIINRTRIILSLRDREQGTEAGREGEREGKGFTNDSGPPSSEIALARYSI